MKDNKIWFLETLLNLSGWRGLRNLKVFSGFLLCVMLEIFHNSPYYTITAGQENCSCFKVRAGSVKWLTASWAFTTRWTSSRAREGHEIFLKVWEVVGTCHIPGDISANHLPVLPIFPPPCGIFMPSRAPLPGNLYFYTMSTIATISLLPNCTYCLTLMLRSNLIAQPF